MRLAIPAVVMLLLTAAIVDSQKPRRDESYPPPDFLARFQIIHDVCRERTGATEEAIAEFSDGEAHEDPDLKCYMNCIFHELNVIDDDGEMHLESFRRLLPDNLRDIGKLMLETCTEPVGETQCDRAWWWHMCWKATDPTHYFLP